MLDGSGNYLKVVLNSETADFAITTSSGLAANDSEILQNQGWQFVSIVLRRSPGTGEYALELYLNGALQTYDAGSLPSVAGGFAGWTSLYVGVDENGSSDPLEMLLDDLVVLPFAPPAAWIAAWYAAYDSQPFPGAPVLDVSGFLLDGDEDVADTKLQVLATDVEVHPVQGTDAGAHAPDMATLRFTLSEV